jgi:hypothetical protein
MRFSTVPRRGHQRAGYMRGILQRLRSLPRFSTPLGFDGAFQNGRLKTCRCWPIGTLWGFYSICVGSRGVSWCPSLRVQFLVEKEDSLLLSRHIREAMEVLGLIGRPQVAFRPIRLRD